jgi:hypothetical protein
MTTTTVAPAGPAAARPTTPEQSRHAAAAAVVADLARARAALVEAEQASSPGECFLAAHVAALRVAAVVLAVRSRPVRNARPRNAWRLLAEVAPELAEWAFFFAATEAKRDAVRAGVTGLVSLREADDLVRDTGCFLALVEHAVAPPGPTRGPRLR